MGSGARNALGRFGEDLAARHLRDAGFEVLAQNWRSSDPLVRGELDLVCRDRAVVVFCEVKTRSSLAFGLPAEAVSFRKQVKIRALARVWLATLGMGWTEVRFDVVSVLRPPAGPVVVDHVRSAF